MPTEAKDGEGKKPTTKGDSPSVPHWARTEFTVALNRLQEISDVLNVSQHGISMLRGIPKLVEALGELEEEAERSTEHLERTRRLADIAVREVDNRFPLLHAQALISLVTVFEAFIRDYLATWLANEPDAKRADVLRKIKIPLLEYEELESPDRHRYVIERLEQEVGTPLKEGISRYESLLRPFGLAGSIDDGIRRDLFEMFHLRNLLVHRRGTADGRFIKACPWLGFAIGDEVGVSPEMFHKYEEATASYLLEMLGRVCDHFGVPRPMRQVQPVVMPTSSREA